MNIYMVVLAFALAVPAAVLCLLGMKRHEERNIQRLKAFADTLPDEERAVFWRLHQNRHLWNGSRYPKAFQNWKKRRRREALAEA